MSLVNPFKDPIAFSRFLRVPETGEPLVFPPAQERFLREFLTPLPDGGEAYAEGLFSAPKKSLKTTMGALAALFIPFMVDEPYAEVIICANDLEQSQSRVFEQAVRLIRTN